MNRLIIISALLAALSLAACDQGPTVVKFMSQAPQVLRAQPAAKALKATKVTPEQKATPAIRVQPARPVTALQ